MSGRIGAIDTAGKHRHRDSPGGKRAAMRRLVDAIGRAADDGHSLCGQVATDLAGLLQPITGGGSRTDHRDRRATCLRKGEASFKPQPDGGATALLLGQASLQSGEPLGPFIISWTDESNALLFGRS